jgi:hypothetical protein
MSETNLSLFQSDVIDNGLSNFTAFLNYIRKHIDRLTIRAGKPKNKKTNFCF